MYSSLVGLLTEDRGSEREREVILFFTNEGDTKYIFLINMKVILNEWI